MNTLLVCLVLAHRPTSAGTKAIAVGDDGSLHHASLAQTAKTTAGKGDPATDDAAAELGNIAQGIGKDRPDNTEFTKVLKDFQKVPWNTNAWQRQSTLIGTLKMNQVTAQNEAKKVEASTAQKLIMAIHAKAPMFNDAALAISTESQKLISEAQKLRVDLEISTNGFNTKVENLREKIDALRAHDEAVVQSLNNRMEVEYETIDNDMSLTKSEVSRKKADLLKDIETDKNKATVKLDNLQTRIDNARKITNKEIERLKQKHTQNVQKVNDATSEFEAYKAEIKKVIDELPEFAETKIAELKEKIKQESQDRGTAINALKEQAKDSQNLLNQEAGELAGDLARDFQENRQAAVSARDKRMAELGTDTENFAAAASDAVMKLNSDNMAVQGKLQDYATQTQMNLANTESRLATAVQRVKSFGPEAEKEVAALAALTTQQFQKVQESRDKSTSVALGKFKRDAQKIEVEAVQEINEKVSKLLDNAQKSVKRAAYRAEADVTPAADRLSDLVSQVGQAATQISDLEAEQKAVAKRIEQTGDTVNTAAEKVKGEIEDSNKEITNQARAAADESKQLIYDDEKAVKAAMEEGQKKIASASDAIKVDFNAQTKEVKSHIDKSIVEQTQDVGKIERLSNDMLNALTQKVSGVNQQLDYISGVPGDATQMGKVAELSQDAQDFMNEADGAIKSMPAKALEAVGIAQTSVTDSMEKLQKAGEAAVQKVKDDTASAIKKNENLAESAKTTLQNEEITLKQEAQKSMTAVDDEVKKAEDTNTATNTAITNMKANVDEGTKTADNVIESEKSHLESETRTMKEDLNAAENDWSNILAGAKQTVKEKADAKLLELQERFRSIVGNEDEGAKKEVADAQKKLSDAIEAAVEKIVKHAAPLAESTATLKNIMQEAKDNEASATAAAKAAAANLQKDVDKAQQDSASFADQTKDYLDAESQKVSKEAEEAFKEASEAGEKGMKQASKEAAGYADEAGSEVKKANEQFAGSLGQFKSNAARETEQVTDEVQKLNSEVNAEELTEQQKTEQLRSKFDAIKEKAEKANNAFEREMSKSHALLSRMLESSGGQMAELLGKLRDLQDDAKHRVGNQTDDDKAFLDKLVEAAKDAATQVQGKVAATQQAVDEFSTKLASVDKEANEALEKAQQMAEDFDQKLSLTSRRFLQQLEEEKQGRKKATQDLLHETKHSMDALGKVMDAIVQLETKVGAQVKYQLGTLDLDEKKLDRGLSEALELEKYQEEGAIDKVREKLKKTQEREAAIMAWKTSAEAAAKKFRGLVQEEFKNMGEELDMTAVDLAESQATESWAVQQQEAHLKDVLGKELGDLSAVSEARLAALAKSSGAELAKILATTEEGSKERAEALAKLKADSAKRAQEILEENGRLKLDQETAARNLQIATDEVQSSMTRIASLEHAQAPAAGLHGVLDRIKGLINSASAHMDGVPDDLPTEENKAAEGEPADVNATDGAADGTTDGTSTDGTSTNGTSTDGSLLETDADPEGLLEVALRTTQQALGEDASWKKRLGSLLR